MDLGPNAPRRRKLRLGVIALALLLALVAAACGSDDDTSADASTDGGSSGGGKKIKLVYAGFGGALGDAEQKAYFEPFMKDNPNIEVVYDDGVDFAKLKAMVETKNPTWDVYTGDLYAPDPSEFFEKIDCSQVPCDEIIDDNNVNDYVQIYYTYSNVITYDESKVQDGPKTWADFFDTKKFPGKRALSGFSGSAASNMMMALLADGVPADKLWPLDYDRALKKLDTIKNDIVWFETNAQCPQLIRDGEAKYGNCLNGRVYNAIQDGAKLHMEWEGNISGSGVVAVVKGSKHADAAQKLVAYMLDKENNARLSEFIAYGPTNKNAFDKTSPTTKDYLVSSHTDATSALYDWPFIAKHGDEIGEKFDTWRQS